jgi:sensor histidine kinase YesM
MNSDSTFVSLDQALPSDVANSRLGLFSYRNYPVFSLPWLKRRSMLFGVAVTMCSLFVFVGMWLGSKSFQTGLFSTIHFFLGFMIMVSAGPSLATWIRYRRLPLPKERYAVVIAIMLGVVASYFADQWSSGYLKKVFAEQNFSGVDAKNGNATGQDLTTRIDANGKKPARGPWALTVNVIWLLVVYGALGGGLALRAYFSEQHRLTVSHHKRELEVMRLQKDETALRMSVLQAQVEPHFLFNTLASLRSLVRQDPARAETTIDALVDHLRATIPRMRDDTGKLTSTLGQQLDICASYLELMQVRMGSRLRYEVSVPDSFRELEFPPLMLISLVENAIKHGIETKPGEGRIQIHAEKIVSDAREEKLKVSVLDNGPGLSEGVGGGLGLANIRAQLKARFGTAAALGIGTRSEGGTIASIELPLSTSNENA